MMKKLILAALLFSSSQVLAAEMNDDWITLKAKLALMVTDDLDTKNLHVDSNYGVVSLFGRVTSEASKQAAIKSVAGIDGVKRVEDLLQVVPASQEKATAASDDEIKRVATENIKNSPHIYDSKIEILSVDKGVVVLGGQAKTLAMHVAAVDAIDRVNGVKRIETKVTVENDKGGTVAAASAKPAKTASGVDDAWVTTQVKLRMMANPNVSGTKVHVDTRNQEVFLFGSVPSEQAKTEAEREAKSVSGIAGVRNELVVRPEKASTATAEKDQDIEARAKKLLSKEDLKNIQVKVSQGIVNLTGKVSSEAEKARVALLMSTAKGVRAVRTELLEMERDVDDSIKRAKK